MKIHFDIQKYPGTNDVVVCKTREEVDAFAEYLDSVGRKWIDGGSYVGRDKIINIDGNLNDNGGFVYYFNQGTYGSYKYWVNEYSEWGTAIFFEDICLDYDYNITAPALDDYFASYLGGDSVGTNL